MHLYSVLSGEIKKFLVHFYNDKNVDVDENIKVRFRDAGHMLGSSVIEVWVTEDGNLTTNAQDLLNTLEDIASMIYDTEDFEQLDDLIEVGDKLSVILKRIGETQILEAGQNKGDLADDFQTYEVQREFGLSVVLPQYFGCWQMQ